MFGEGNHGWQPDEIRRVVPREQARSLVDEVCKLVLLDIPGHVGVLFGELFGEFEGNIEPRLEVGIQHDWISAATGELVCRSSFFFNNL